MLKGNVFFGLSVFTSYFFPSPYVPIGLMILSFAVKKYFILYKFKQII